jgi:hypothetical protein
MPQTRAKTNHSATSYKVICPRGNGNVIPTKKSTLHRSSSGASNNGSVRENRSPIIGNETSGTGGSESSIRYTLSSSWKIITLPTTDIIKPSCMNKARIRDFALRHLFNCEIASTRDENLFLGILTQFSYETAIYLAARHRWKCQRPLRALLVAMSESDRNCNAQSAKRKRLLGSSASSRKRSSGA